MPQLRALQAAFILVLALPAALPAHADATADAKKAIETVYTKRDAAAARKDVKGFLSAYTSDYVYVAKDGQKGDLKVLKKKIVPLFTFMQSVQAVTAIQKFTTSGKQATATVKEHLEMLIIDPNTQMPKKLVADAVSDDLWTKTGSGWQQKRTKTRTEKATLDGNSIDSQLNLGGQSGSGSKKPAKSSGKSTSN